jgi:hypothetical protein
MPSLRLLAVGAGALALALPSVAHAGGVSSNGTTITFAGGAGAESVSFSSEAGQTFVRTTTDMTPGLGCTINTLQEVRCNPTPALSATTLGADDSIDARGITDGSALTAASGAGADEISGTKNADLLSGEGDDDRLVGGEGNDTLDGGAGGDGLEDEGGNDTVVGGPNDDRWTAGTGTDTFSGGDGDDSVSYSGRTGAVTITLDGVADDGEAGEADTVGADVEGAIGGSGADRIVGNALGNRLSGGGGNDSIAGGPAEDRLEGNEGDDTIDSRDGRFDSIDCGPGTDTLLADPGDSAANCEIAPDRDGDGTLNEADCAPDNAAVHPGAGEIVGNAVDEDCKDGPLYFKVATPISWNIAKRPRQSEARFVTLRVRDLKAGDKVEIRCVGGKSKRCPFSKKTVTATSRTKQVDVAKLLKKRYLKRNGKVEIRVTRANEIGRFLRLTVQRRGLVKSEALCINVGAKSPSRCS